MALWASTSRGFWHYDLKNMITTFTFKLVNWHNHLPATNIALSYLLLFSKKKARGPNFDPLAIFFSKYNLCANAPITNEKTTTVILNMIAPFLYFWILFTEKFFPLKNNFLHDTLKNDILKSLRYLWNILAIFSISYNIN